MNTSPGSFISTQTSLLHSTIQFKPQGLSVILITLSQPNVHPSDRDMDIKHIQKLSVTQVVRHVVCKQSEGEVTLSTHPPCVDIANF